MKIMASMSGAGIDPSGSHHLSQLPLEIQLLILQNLDFVEFSRFNAVCKAWRSIASAARQSPCFRLQQVPWFIHGLEIPKLFGLEDTSRICGSSREWLLLRRYTANFLLNPITRRRISLPEAPKYIMEVGVVILPDHHHHQSVALRGDGIFTVVAYFQDDSFYHWRSQDEHWTRICAMRLLSDMMISDMIYHKGNIYAITKYCSQLLNGIFIISSDEGSYRWLRTGSPILWSPLLDTRPSRNLKRLVECDGDLLMVLITIRMEATVLKQVGVFKYNPIGRQSYWEKVESIGEKYALLVGKGSSMAIDVSTNTTTSFRANCIYFFDYGSRLGIQTFNLGTTHSRPS